MQKGKNIFIYFPGLNILILFFLSFASINAQTKVEKGVLDLRQEYFRDEVIKLNGDWAFYWNEHLGPHDFKEAKKTVPDTWVQVPSYWSSYAKDIPGIKATGYASYHIKILLPDNVSQLVFDIPVFDSAFRIYIDGRLAGSSGVAGKSKAETKAGYEPFLYRHNDSDGEIEIIVNVSNYHHRRGGFWLPMRMARPDTMLSYIESQKTLTGILTGILLSFALFFLLFYLLFKRDDSTLFFSLATFGVLLRSITTGSFLIFTFINIDWDCLIRLEYTGSFIALIFGSWYFYRIFPDRYFKLVNLIITISFSLILLFVWLTPVLIFSNSIRIFFPAVSIILVYYGIKSIRSFDRDKSTAILNITGFIFLLLAAVHDIMLSKSSALLSDNYILPYGTVIFILLQVIILINRWVRSFNEEKRLSCEIEYVNRNLEDIVIERTSELSRRKSELERQKNEIQAKNDELGRSMHVKNRIFSIIAHDIKAPVVNLSMLTEMLKEEYAGEKDKNFIKEIEKQVDFTHSLIDNLLIWGQGQQNQINYRPSACNITDMVLQCFNLLNPRAEAKEISMSFSHRGSPMVWCDPDLVSIIIRNLVSNSIKFTPQNGKITVLAEYISGINPHLVISVIDTGTGLDPGILNALEEDRIIKSTQGTGGEKGTGLGLQLCYDLIKINKGSMQIDSDVKKGSSISFTLPAKNRK